MSMELALLTTVLFIPILWGWFVKDKPIKVLVHSALIVLATMSFLVATWTPANPLAFVAFGIVFMAPVLRAPVAAGVRRLGT